MHLCHSHGLLLYRCALFRYTIVVNCYKGLALIYVAPPFAVSARSYIVQLCNSHGWLLYKLPAVTINKEAVTSSSVRSGSFNKLIRLPRTQVFVKRLILKGNANFASSFQGKTAKHSRVKPRRLSRVHRQAR